MKNPLTENCCLIAITGHVLFIGVGTLGGLLVPASTGAKLLGRAGPTSN